MRRYSQALPTISCAMLLTSLGLGLPAPQPPPANSDVTRIYDDGAHRASPETPLYAVSYFAFSPMVIRDVSTTNPYFYIQTDGTITTAQFRLAIGQTVSLANGGGGLFSVTLTNTQALYGYTANDYNHNFVGYLDIFAGAVKEGTFNIFINVIDSRVPQVTAQTVSAQAKKTPHLVNLYLPGLYPATMNNTYVTQHFYQDFGDNYDFLNIIYTPQHFDNRYHSSTHNDVSGIGLASFDNDATYGVPATHRLKGISVYPIWDYFDMAERSSIHELGHQWINFLDVSSLQGVTPHWPISSLAYGIMGTQCCGNPQGLDFPWTLSAAGGGNYNCASAQRALAFNDVELYLMGFLPSSAVSSHFAFTNQNQNCPGTLVGPVQAITVQNIINQHGVRSPSWLTAQRKFRVATIVVSQSFLSADEMSFLDYFASRGSLTIPIRYTSGLISGTTWPFYLATGGRGCLVTTIDHDGGCHTHYLPVIRH
jgi:hypothetical protein